MAACLGLVFGVAVRNLAYYPLQVTSNSMSPSVKVGDWVVISPQHDAAKAVVNRGDIVLFRFPFGSTGRAIKRVIAVAGDHVEADRNDVRVNGKSAVYGSETPISNTVAASLAGQVIVVPEGYYYILGDNVASSVDSRSLGLLPETEVLGRVTAIVKKPW